VRGGGPLSKVRIAQHLGAEPVTKDLCEQEDSLLASPFRLVIERSVPLKLSIKLCDPPLLSTGDGLLEGSFDGGILNWLSTYAEGSLEQLLVEGKIRGHVLLIC
jgi:hypothetical protein